MRHLKEGKKFGRLRGDRISFLRNLANDVIRAGHIETTEARAKAVRPIVEKLITIAKQKDLAGRRLIASRVQNQRIVKKLCDDLGTALCRPKRGLSPYHETAKGPQTGRRKGRAR